jgi:endonuclease G
MRFTTLALFISLLFISATPPKNLTVSNDVFTVVYSETLQQPLLVKYTVACTETKFSRKGLDFYTYKGVTTSDNADYENNPYDKGHMAPAADFACDQAKLKTTFSYLNCALQQQDLNRGVWRLLESHERDMAKSANTSIEITVHFSAKSTKLQTGATVPDGFTKVITSGKTVEKYYFPNIKPTKAKYVEYKI